MAHLRLLIVALLGLVAAVPTTAVQQPEDPSLAAGRAAIGGDAALERISAVTATGSVNTWDGQVSDLVVELALPGRFRTAQHLTMPMFGTGDVFRVLNGDRAWVEVRTRSAMPGSHVVQSDEGLSEDRLREVLRSELAAYALAWLLRPAAAFVRPFAHDADAERAERGKLDVLASVDEQGHPVRLFLDAKTHRPARVEYWGSTRQIARGAARFSIGPGRPGVAIGRPGAERLPDEATIVLQLDDFKSEHGVLVAHRVRKRIEGDEIEELRFKRFSFDAVTDDAFENHKDR